MSIGSLYSALINGDDAQVDVCLEEIARDDNAAETLLDVFKDDDDYLHEFHTIVHLLDQLPPKQVYHALTVKLMPLFWRTPQWANYIVNGMLNGVKSGSCQIDFSEFLGYVAENANDDTKKTLLQIVTVLVQENKVKTDAARLATELLSQ